MVRGTCERGWVNEGRTEISLLEIGAIQIAMAGHREDKRRDGAQHRWLNEFGRCGDHVGDLPQEQRGAYVLREGRVHRVTA